VIIYPAVEMIINQEAGHLKGIPINGMDELTNG
jgi:hypothetical protein